MRIDFVEDTHTYLVNGDIASISVTQLLAKHGISPDYSAVDEDRMKESAKAGKEIHKDLENILNQKGYEPKTEQGKNFLQWADDNIDCAVGEQMLAYEHGGMIIAGTADIMGFLKDGTPFIGDHKTTSNFYKESVTWQVSLLDMFAKKMSGSVLNGKQFNWTGASKFFCFHYDTKTGEMQVKELERTPDEEMNNLIEAEYQGGKYQRKALVLEDDLAKQVELAEQALAQAEEQKKIAQKQAEELRSKLIYEMKRQGVKSWETDKIKATYIYPSERITVDSRVLKSKYPMVYKECTSLSKVKETVRITIRDKENKE